MVVMAEAVTAADGTYSLAGYPARYSVDVRADGYLDLWVNTVDELAEGQVRTGADGEMRLFTSVSGSISCDRCDEPAVGDQLPSAHRAERRNPLGARLGSVGRCLGDADRRRRRARVVRIHQTERTGARPVPGDGLGWGWAGAPGRTISPTITVADGAEVTLDLDVEFPEARSGFLRATRIPESSRAQRRTGRC